MNPFALACFVCGVIGLGILCANLANLSQTAQISDLRSRTKVLESALKAYNIPFKQEVE